MECETATDWIIDEKDLREVGEDKWIDSKTVQTTIPGVEYNITAFPNDDTDGEHEVAFFLYVETRVVKGKFPGN
uniref:Uncharacterized protein n=1 Tax=Panagrolaimus davidi TaxID=227884 RepID=A0A914PVN2_9BILA